VNTITHPDYRGWGIFFVLAAEAYRDRSNNHLDVIFGIPNTKNYLNTLNAGFKNIECLPIFVKINRTPKSLFEPLKKKVPFLGNLLSLPFLNFFWKIIFFAFPFFSRGKIKIKEIGCADKRFDLLWEKVADRHKNICIRDREYVSWRFFKNPNVEYVVLTAERDGGELKGYVVLLETYRGVDKIGVIVDILAEDDNIYSRLIKASLKYFKMTKVAYVMALSNKFSKNNVIYNEFGFRMFPPKLQRSPVRFMFMKFSDEMDESAILNLEDWYLTFADFDLY
ncbi:MAG: hypothetical protein KKH83_05805, partial [Candidatus Margulisbacteria bacterium]|nr:hypothetical protein [Candidatus Margulisiibacteriota bacterium]